jgi:pimeloyl-ACP methyl ester carboxylesterase
METVTHHGRTTAYERAPTEGSGRADADTGGESASPICYVHGSGGDRGLWRAQLERVTRPAVALDLSGHGDSDDADADPGYEALSVYADDVLAVVEATDAGVLAGNSLGGAVALHLLVERAFTPEAVVLCGTGAKLTVLEDLRAWLAEDFERAIDFLHGPDRLFHDPAPEAVERSTATLRETGRATTRRDFETCHRFDVRDRLDEVGVPALALCGTDDGLTPPRYHEYLAEGISGGELAVVDDAAHLAMLERPAVFDAAVEDFLGSI